MRRIHIDGNLLSFRKAPWVWFAISGPARTHASTTRAPCRFPAGPLAPRSFGSHHRYSRSSWLIDLHPGNGYDGREIQQLGSKYSVLVVEMIVCTSLCTSR